ncbi:unnamed protein product [Penicillium salamii]|uniref:F-box domain-containing protein n=1 Tax=Penicillium salamii TaxID=1612424 RepID=A0A9W4JN11_9EURO|nr:unnamed protein product [Penicillium salamii]CAG8298618.1 unnamed protein product [Penicillium salamii]CAG8352932.1 unnamed protein product [Penicillium salamii]CAG8359323.1 unnamed protein product [Penicillium salamii]CAG8381788.1 unnamed protein product [Penicillium salamii]
MSDPVAESNTFAQRPGITTLPYEIFLLIKSQISSQDRKSLSQTCKALENLLPVSFPRVFISTNPLDIKAFRGIADDPKLREQVTEIIWDESRFTATPDIFVKEFSGNFTIIRQRAEETENDDHAIWQKRKEAELTIRNCWGIYDTLSVQQNQTMKSGDDEAAFVYGLSRFPALKRVTITPAAHGTLFAPRYPTPTIRSLPFGFNYAVPRAWPQLKKNLSPIFQPPGRWSKSTEEYKEHWHGTRIVLRVLGQVEHTVSELCFDLGGDKVGLNITMLDQPCVEYDHFVSMLRNSRLSRLDLPLYVWDGKEEWSNESSGHLYRALSEATDLIHFSVPTTYTMSYGDAEVQLGNLLPIEKWPLLQHIGLKCFNVSESFISKYLESRPSTLRSVEIGLSREEYESRKWVKLREAMGSDKSVELYFDIDEEKRRYSDFYVRPTP